MTPQLALAKYDKIRIPRLERLSTNKDNKATKTYRGRKNAKICKEHTNGQKSELVTVRSMIDRMC